MRGELPGKGKEIKTEAKVLGEQAGSKFDETVSHQFVSKHIATLVLISNIGRGSKETDQGVRRQGTGLRCRHGEIPREVQEGGRKGAQRSRRQVRQDG